ncbi:glycogen synthase GlgA [Acidiphilium sp.]|uniref:glycogen synthase GlgA n=1 Tax=Acidiphilium sp. TaxID=527 RepID=UPI00258AE317|nr:glycogen synthase GlgA [Acidiphilium sp.]
MDVTSYDPSVRRLRVLFATAELFPLAKTGGLGDACAALPVALAASGVDVRAILPGYVSALDTAQRKHTISRLPGGGTLLAARTPDSGLPVYLLDWPELFRRPGSPYQDQDKREWPDNLRRFAAFSAAAAALAGEGDPAGWRPDLVHANDWHTGLLPAFLALRHGAQPPSLFTIHNLAYQGNFPLDTARALALPEALLTPDGAEFYGQFSCLKAGLRYADRLTTVSPTYAREILTPEFGAGLDGLLRARAADLTGILNGIDTDLWNPAADPALPVPFDADHLAGKQAAKAALRQELDLDPAADGPLVIGVNRLTEQKMADVVLAALPDLLAMGAQVALHGEGDPGLEAAFRDAASRHPGRIAVRIGYQETLAHRLNAAADLALTPSRFEPCGLTTMYAMRYGALPVTRRVGGLADTVTDIDNPPNGRREGTGFIFDDPTAAGLVGCLRRAGRRFRDPVAWRRAQRAAMGRDFGWEMSARRYRALYDDLVVSADAPQPPASAFLEAAE